jgi:TetR/AcrR family transcriptional regulator, regulator of cefoperazone and chloramphenicol sensitivity
VIQYHFGTRENLLLAVVQYEADQLRQLLETLTVEGDTPEARLDSLAEAIWRHYRQPEFLASMQTTLNLAKDPNTSARTSSILAELEEPISRLWLGLIRRALPNADRSVAATVFETLRGVAIGEALLHAFPHRRPPADVDRALVVRALASALDGAERPTR